MITFDEKVQRFELNNGHVSYLMEIVAGRYLTHLYFGQAINFSGNISYPLITRAFSPYPADMPSNISLDTLRLEYPGAGFGDYRVPAYDIHYPDGSAITDFQFTHYEIMAGKPELNGLPASFASENKCEMLIIYLEDTLTKMEVALSYSIYMKIRK